MSVAALVTDPQNRRAHPARNLEMITASLKEVGAARAIVIDEDNLILAGNGVTHAAPAAGLDRVRIIDADGDELIAVRRRGLTDTQKRALAMYDNRTGELATWDLAQLATDVKNDLDLAPFFFDAEVHALLDVPTGAEWNDSVAKLPITDHAGYQQVAFILTAAQVEIVKGALARAKAAGDFGDTGNSNSNGNAIARICEAYGIRENDHPPTD